MVAVVADAVLVVTVIAAVIATAVAVVLAAAAAPWWEQLNFHTSRAKSRIWAGQETQREREISMSILLSCAIL